MPATLRPRDGRCAAGGRAAREGGEARTGELESGHLGGCMEGLALGRAAETWGQETGRAIGLVWRWFGSGSMAGSLGKMMWTP